MKLIKNGKYVEMQNIAVIVITHSELKFYRSWTQAIDDPQDANKADYDIPSDLARIAARKLTNTAIFMMLLVC